MAIARERSDYGTILEADHNKGVSDCLRQHGVKIRTGAQYGHRRNMKATRLMFPLCFHHC